MITETEAVIMQNDNREALHELFSRLHREHGDKGPDIIKTILEELGGLRLTIPSLKLLYREERNNLIINKFNGVNYKELAILFDLSEEQVRRIIKDG